MADRTALYARISEDPLGLERGVGRQLDDGRALLTSRGWAAVGEYVDNDTSALTGKRRPQYEALMRDVEAGNVDRIVTYMQSRLWRNRRERAEAIELLRRRKVGVVCVKGPELDLSTATGRMLAGLLGEFDTHESEVKGERVARAAEARALAGQANGAVLYGWRREYDSDDRGRVVGFRDVVDDEAAAVVREIVDRLLEGARLRALTADLNRRGLPSPQGIEWAHTSVRKVALRPANIARRMHNGVDVGPAAWPAIVGEDKHAAVVALLNDPARRKNAAAAFAEDGRMARRYLLTFGIGRCGVCGSVLRQTTKRLRRKVARERTEDNPEGVIVSEHDLYVCNRTQSCVGRNRARVDELVEGVVVERLSRPDALELLRPEPAGGDEVADREAAELRQRLDDAAEDYSEGLIDREQLRRITAALRPRLEEAQAARTAARGPSAPELAELVGADDVRALWQSFDVHQRRAVMQELLEVVIMPTKRKGPTFDPTAVGITWKAS